MVLLSCNRIKGHMTCLEPLLTPWCVHTENMKEKKNKHIKIHAKFLCLTELKYDKNLYAVAIKDSSRNLPNFLRPLSLFYQVSFPFYFPWLLCLWSGALSRNKPAGFEDVEATTDRKSGSTFDPVSQRRNNQSPLLYKRTSQRSRKYYGERILSARFLLFQRQFNNFTNTFLLCPPARKRLQLLAGWLCFYSSGYEAGNAHGFGGSVRHE